MSPPPPTLTPTPKDPPFIDGNSLGKVSHVSVSPYAIIEELEMWLKDEAKGGCPEHSASHAGSKNLSVRLS